MSRKYEKVKVNINIHFFGKYKYLPKKCILKPKMTIQILCLNIISSNPLDLLETLVVLRAFIYKVFHLKLYSHILKIKHFRKKVIRFLKS